MPHVSAFLLGSNLLKEFLKHFHLFRSFKHGAVFRRTLINYQYSVLMEKISKIAYSQPINMVVYKKLETIVEMHLQLDVGVGKVALKLKY